MMWAIQGHYTGVLSAIVILTRGRRREPERRRLDIG